ncbi:hypothetical protein CHU92_00290 [Flavobacterium cyanobacteriorum]|uniref:Response regulatory domain-containing protein n=1 Tax=Flavobacterium cyanobacteriorum TaxID=2022802 RepID=A0A256A7F9_9FLAO|nr:response regulator transcription factor [Flavobacterium cyanobacteriorum]OYQ49686.1 hypothetical protein CHU92_00290 [Flavobacterium cyanobacteriorum]
MEKSNNLILVVEDELIIAADISRILRNEGFRCITNITSYDEAVSKIEDFNPDLVLVDIMLGKNFDGIKIGEYLNNKGTIPFIFLTSLSDKNTLINVKNTFPSGYIVKPYKPTDILTNIDLALYNFRHNKININQIKSPEIKDDTPYRIKKVIQHINNNLHEKLHLEELISLTPWKKHQFINIFKLYTGTTPYQYILECKLEKCTSLMLQSHLSLNDIALELGFDNYSNFSKLFKKKYNEVV